ncbi:hypothetical protein [Proteus phage 3H10_20]|uniref:Uncharacterized protein n=1 Tax=Proteus phage 3H10_20 TaxID=2772448 RepID=A0A7L7SH42_9CAUD|nr:hypothetical protein PQC37_gp122 [Proteus phage 3H10_20]QOC54899.1 hypothetical protein [Proteus phage 3H10_20]
MKDLWVLITLGDRESSEIVGVFSSYEKAIDVVKSEKITSYAIEVRELDSIKDWLGY